eukprot:1956172-Lingulodinium_polyedra.AAC.1
MQDHAGVYVCSRKHPKLGAQFCHCAPTHRGFDCFEHEVVCLGGERALRESIRRAPASSTQSLHAVISKAASAM